MFTTTTEAKAGVQTKFPKLIDATIAVVAVAMVAYHLISTQYLVFGPELHQNTHFGFALLLIFLASMKARRRRWPLFLVLILLGLWAVIYMHVNYKPIMGRQGHPTPWDIAIGIILVVVALEATRESWGIVLPIVIIIAIIYAFTSQYMPGVFYHSYKSLGYIVSWLSVGFQGMYGTALGVSANYIFLFIVFGALLQATGASGFFMEIGKIAGRKLRGGPAQTAVVSSMLVGMISGSAAANVALTGVFTIPLMKKMGYPPYQAGAIEATASTGGQFTPPVMGASAFLMAALTGISYFDIVKAAVIPALLYYIAVACYIEIAARKRAIPAMTEKVSYSLLFQRAPLFLVPLLVLVVLLAKYYSPMFSVFWAILILAVLAVIRKDTRPSFQAWVTGFVDGATTGAKMAAVCAAVGFVMSIFTFTGLGLRISSLVEAWSQGYLWLGLVLAMVVSLILGCGVPTVAAYLLVAITVAPVFVGWGVGLLQAHFFVFFFAIFSAITPPVAMAALVGSGIARAPYFKTAFEACKIAIPAFIIAYAIIFNPTLIMQPPGVFVGLMTILATLLGVFAIASVSNLHYMGKLSFLEGVIMVASALGLFGYVFTMNWWLLSIGTGLFIIVTLWEWRKKRAAQKAIGGIFPETTAAG